MSDVPLVSIGIVGFGEFARVIAANLRSRFHILTCDPSEAARSLARQSGVTVASLAEVARCPVIVLAVPLHAFEDCVSALSGHLAPGQIVIDVCSVKQEPARIMRALFPPDIDIVATHPMFGPRSARDGVAGHSIVLCPVRGRRWRRVAAFLRASLKLEVIVTTPEEHDRQVAASQGLTHLLAHAFQSLGARPTIRTPSFDLLMKALDMVRHDSPGVFEAVTRGNPHVALARDRLVEELQRKAL